VEWVDYYSILTAIPASRPSVLSFMSQSATSLAGTLFREKVGVENEQYYRWKV